MVLAVFGGHCRLADDCIKDEVSESESGSDYEDRDDDDDLWEGNDYQSFLSTCFIVRHPKPMFSFSDISSSQDSLDEETLKELSEGLEDLSLAEKFCRSPLPEEENGRKKRSKAPVKKMAEFRLDEWIHLRMEKNAAHQLFALRRKWQVCSRRLFYFSFRWKFKSPLSCRLCLLVG